MGTRSVGVTALISIEDADPDAHGNEIGVHAYGKRAAPQNGEEPGTPPGGWVLNPNAPAAWINNKHATPALHKQTTGKSQGMPAQQLV